MGILNSNDYDRGYQDGYRDAKAGNDKSYAAAGLSAKFLLHGNDALETYNRGYDEGYRIGMQDRCRGN